MNYSPDRRRYVSLDLAIGLEDGSYYFDGGDDCQTIYLFDRDRKRSDLVLWLGTSAFAEAVFWIDNQSFAIVGKQFAHAVPRYFISVFDLTNHTVMNYEILPHDFTNQNPPNHGEEYVKDTYLKKLKQP